MNDNNDNGFIRLKTVLNLYPVSKSTWWNGCRDGRFPKPYKLSKKVTAWKLSDIQKLLSSHE
ncbi:helix-turn-helix transcriptional regulator [Pedobacter sp. KACC 23697]|uniref:helix-turn-helix transcriptional regulator n=1 Tax=Pedobacter sp. KACC 23697 TaxID=3149230 RepID=UPI003878343A